MKKEVIEKLNILVISAFGLIAALAWNEAITNFIQNSFLSKYGPWVYAILVTVIAVFVAVWLGKINKKFK